MLNIWQLSLKIYINQIYINLAVKKIPSVAQVITWFSGLCGSINDTAFPSLESTAWESPSQPIYNLLPDIKATTAVHPLLKPLQNRYKNFTSHIMAEQKIFIITFQPKRLLHGGFQRSNLSTLAFTSAFAFIPKVSSVVWKASCIARPGSVERLLLLARKQCKCVAE